MSAICRRQCGLLSLWTDIYRPTFKRNCLLTIMVQLLVQTTWLLQLLTLSIRTIHQICHNLAQWSVTKQKQCICEMKRRSRSPDVILSHVYVSRERPFDHSTLFNQRSAVLDTSLDGPEIRFTCITKAHCRVRKIPPLEPTIDKRTENNSLVKPWYHFPPYQKNWLTD
jgi:hypothetical protein